MTHKIHMYEITSLPLHTKAILGGYSGIALGSCALFGYKVVAYDFVATMLLHPCDMVRMRLQAFPMFSRWTVIINMLHFEGLRPSLYTGLSTGLLRQTAYTCTRLSTYYLQYAHHKSSYDKLPSFPEQMAFGVNAAVLAAIVECPTELILVRLASDGRATPFRRYHGYAPPFRRYEGCIHAFTKIKSQEGLFRGFLRGVIPSMLRSVIITLCQIVTYSTYKSSRKLLLEKHLDTGFQTDLYVSMASSFVIAALTLPIDTIKTRHQAESSGTLCDSMEKFRNEHGRCGYWRGFSPYYIRLTFHTLITIYLLEILDNCIGDKRKS